MFPREIVALVEQVLGVEQCPSGPRPSLSHAFLTWPCSFTIKWLVRLVQNSIASLTRLHFMNPVHVQYCLYFRFDVIYFLVFIDLLSIKPASLLHQVLP